MNSRLVVKIFGVVLSFLLLSFARPAWCAPPLIDHQGFLTDAGGQPITGALAMGFEIFTDAAAGAPGAGVWQESHPAVTVTNGVYEVVLGSVNPGTLTPDLFVGDDLWLEVTVAGEALSPRQRITSTSFAHNADLLDGKDSSVFLDTSDNTPTTLLGPLVLPMDGLSVGTNQFYLKSGRVGIGTSNPSRELEVNGTIEATTFSGSGASLTNIPAGNLIGTVSTSRYSAISDLVAEGAAGVTVAEIGYVDGVTGNIQSQLDGKSPKDKPVFTGPIDLPAGVWTNGGAVGIGTKNPLGSMLQVDGNVKVSNGGYFINKKYGSTPHDDASFVGFWWAIRSNAATNTPFNIDYYSTPAIGWLTGFSMDRDGYVGIGTDNPSSRLDIVGDIEVSGVVDGRNIGLDGTKLDSISYNASDTTNDSWVGTANTYKASGRVGIGLSSPSAGLHVKGNGYPESFVFLDTNVSGQDSGIRLRENGSTKWHFYNVGSGADVLRISPQANFSTGGFTIQQNGNVGIGDTTPTYKLTVNGTAYATGAAGALSDRRHKKNIEDLSFDALEVVEALRPVSFDWKDPLDAGMVGTQFGFVAQEVEEVLPEVVLTQDDEEQTKGLKYSALIPILTKAIQELRDQHRVLLAWVCEDHPDARPCVR